MIKHYPKLLIILTISIIFAGCSQSISNEDIKLTKTSLQKTADQVIFLYQVETDVFETSVVKMLTEIAPTTTATLTPSPTSESAYVPTPTPKAVDECGVFEEVTIERILMLPMYNCNTNLTFHYKMSAPIPGLMPSSSDKWHYWSTVGESSGDCYLDSRFDDRLYCTVGLSVGDAYSLRRFELFSDRCEDPIYSANNTIPEFLGCDEPGSDPSVCPSEESMHAGEANCKAKGWIWDSNAIKCYCP